MKKYVIVVFCVFSLLLSGCFGMLTRSRETTNRVVITTAEKITPAPTSTPKPTPTPEPTPTPKPTLSPKEMRAQFEAYDYKTVARDPDNYLTEYIKVEGTVVQVMEGDVITMLRVAQDDDYDQIWYVEYIRPEEAPRVLEKDMVTVYGLCSGLITYETALGSSISIPGLTTVLVDIED